MTPAEAKLLLTPPLIFGNPTQIAARNLLREVDDCKEAILACDADHLLPPDKNFKGPRNKKWLDSIRFCECVMKWAPESEEERGGDWSVVYAAIQATLDA